MHITDISPLIRLKMVLPGLLRRVARGDAQLGIDGPSPGNMPNTYLKRQIPIKSDITNVQYSISPLYSNRAGFGPFGPAWAAH